MNNYEEFLKRFKLLASKNRNIVINTLSNIFTMRLIGNKAHGDLAEIGIAEFIKQSQNAVFYFDSLTNGWINYSHNKTLVKLFSLALNSTENGHKLANEILQKDTDKLKNNFNQ